MPSHRPEWFKSTYSAQNGECLEASRRKTEAMDVRDSKDPHGIVLSFTRESWSAFLTDVKGNRFQSD
jgi:hypothetical protein